MSGETSQDPEGLDADARLRRPATPARVTFDVMSAPGPPKHVDGRQMVPVERARAGDEQVFAARLPLAPRDEPIDLNALIALAEAGVDRPLTHFIPEYVVDIDAVADLPSVTSVVASTTVRARHPLPQVRELVLTSGAYPPDSETLACLPGLKTLWAGFCACKLDVATLPAQLEELAISRIALGGGVPELARFTELRRLDLRDGNPKDSMKSLSSLRKLSWLRVRGVRTGWPAMSGCAHLEDVEMHPRLTNLRALGTWKRLRRLTLGADGLRRLDGVEAFSALEHLDLWRARFEDYAPLEKLTRLAEIENVLPQNSRAGRARFLQALAALPELRRLSDESMYETEANALRAAHPSIVLDVYRWRDGAPPPEHSREEVAVHPPEGELTQWWIFESLAERLDLATNYRAESQLKRELARRDPALSKRLEWDTEADNVCVRADSEAEIRAVAQVVSELIARAAARRA